jgi:hypothetical protein
MSLTLHQKHRLLLNLNRWVRLATGEVSEEDFAAWLRAYQRKPPAC